MNIARFQSRLLVSRDMLTDYSICCVEQKHCKLARLYCTQQKRYVGRTLCLGSSKVSRQRWQSDVLTTNWKREGTLLKRT